MTVIRERLGGRIHRFRGSWSKLKLSREVMDWLKGGAPLAFGVKEPPPCRIRVISHPDVAKRVLTDHIKEQLHLGFIREVEREPTVTSPIFTIPKGDTGKWRVIINLRYVNHFQHPGKFRSKGLDQVRLQIQKGDWMTKGNLKHGFHHVAMREEEESKEGGLEAPQSRSTRPSEGATSSKRGRTLPSANSRDLSNTNLHQKPDEVHSEGSGQGRLEVEGYFIIQKAVEDLTSWLEILYTWKGEWLILQPFNMTINTDSSDYGWGAIINKTNNRLRGAWDHHWREKHINVKELQTVMELVRRRKEILRGKTILLHTDNKVAMAYLNRMTGRIPELPEIACNITMTPKEVNARIQAVYIGTKENKIADELSRETDPHRWEVKRKVFQDLERRLGPHTIDQFADQANVKTQRFNTRWENQGGKTADVLSTSWRGEVNWVVPPIPLLPKVVAKIIRRSQSRQ